MTRKLADDASQEEASQETAKLIEGDGATLRVLDEQLVGMPSTSDDDDDGLDPATIAVICLVALGAVGAVVALVIAKRRRDAAIADIKTDQQMERAVQSQRDTNFQCDCLFLVSLALIVCCAAKPRSSRRDRAREDGPDSHRLANVNSTGRRKSSRRSGASSENGVFAHQA